ncbi:hypothetical protein LCGC14_1441700 [marine sediment metagenome]|uniref:Nucleotide modification associated domain-containing protein n=1 Tax=marine sediment metagenome TaxID=412755 RepID=A0A0F9MMD3_9ZZZZ
MRIYIVPIGIESSTGGYYAPILDDGRFIFIPIPETNPKFSVHHPKHQEFIFDLERFHKRFHKNLYNLKPYNEISIKPWPEFTTIKKQGDFLGKHNYNGYPLNSYIPHFDPEFKTFTYGEGSQNKAKTLSSLKEGDILAFYMSLMPPFKNKAKGKFIVGYFTIETIFDYRFGNQKLDYKFIDNRIKNNMHIIRRDEEPVIAVGKKSESRLFEHALQFTDEKWEILPNIIKRIDWQFKTKKLIRGTRILKEENSEKFKELIITHN